MVNLLRITSLRFSSMVARIVFLTVFVAVVMMISISCTSLFYYPSKKVFSRPEQFKLKHSEFFIESLDGVKIHGWHLKNLKEEIKKPKSLILFFHGNAQNITSHYFHLAWMTKEGHEFMIFDYRGYGKSEGHPEAIGVHQDALSALNYGYSEFKSGRYEKLIVYGQSLGGTVVLQALKDFKYRPELDLLVLDSTFLSYKWIAFDIATSNPFTLIFSPLLLLTISDKTAPTEFVKKLDIPTLVIHGVKDKVVPYKFGKELYEKIPGKKWFWQVPDGEHIDVFSEEKLEYRKKFLDFLNDLT